MNAEFRINGTVLETQRLRLRAFLQSDLDDFFTYASVAGVGEMAGWKHHENREESREILDQFIREDKTFAVCLKESGRAVGSLGVERYGMEDRLTEFDGFSGRELGFVLSKDCWGKGLMPEAVCAVSEFLFRERGLDFLTCGYYDFNQRSRRVQEKCGFRPYRKLVFDTRMGTKEPGVLNLLVNPDRPIRFCFSNPETLIWEELPLSDSTCRKSSHAASFHS